MGVFNRVQFFYDKIFVETYFQVSKYDDNPDIPPTFIVSLEQSCNIYTVVILVFMLFKIEIGYVIYSFFIFFVIALMHNVKRYMYKTKRDEILTLQQKPSVLFKLFSYAYLIASIWLPLLLIFSIRP